MHNNSWCWRDFFLLSFTLKTTEKSKLRHRSEGKERKWINSLDFPKIFIWFAIERKRKIENIQQWKVFPFYSISFSFNDDDDDDDDENKRKVLSEWWKIFQSRNVAETFWRIEIFFMKKFPLLREKLKLDEMKTRWNCLRLKLE